MTEEIELDIKKLQAFAFQRGVLAASNKVMDMAKETDRPDLERATLALVATDIYLIGTRENPYDRRDSTETK